MTMCQSKLPAVNVYTASQSFTREKSQSFGRGSQETRSSKATLSPKSIIGSIRSRKSQRTESKSYSETDTMGSKASTVKSVGMGLVKRLLKYISRDKSEKGACASCLDRVPIESLVKLPCQHRYCRPCLREMTFTAIADERLFPPRCCTEEIPSKAVLSSLTSGEKVLFMTTMEEFQTPATERWYCPTVKCGKWISPQRLRPHSRFQKCPYCRTTICSSCRGRDHLRKECPQDPGLTAVLERGRIERWQRCYNCRALVELTFGCDQVTCRCKAKFCYKCGNAWLACNCPMQRLVEPADYFDLAASDNEVYWNDDPEVFFMVAAVVNAEREEEEIRERQQQIDREERNRQGKRRNSLHRRLSRLSMML